MPAPVSVVIPLLGVEPRLGPCLAALGEGLTAGLVRELVLADGGGGAEVAQLAEAAGATLVRSPPGRGVQLAAGAGAARGAWLLFLHADTVLAPGWSRAVARHIAADPDRAGWFSLAFDAPGLAPRLVAGWANLRARLFALPYGDQGLLISRALYARAGGFPPVPLMEDVALARALGRRRLAPLGATAVTSAARYEAEGWLRRGARNLSTLALWFAGADPARLARRYEGRR